MIPVRSAGAARSPHPPRRRPRSRDLLTAEVLASPCYFTSVEEARSRRQKAV